MNVRRLAAIDMYGGAGRTWRRWVILGEFLLGFVALVTVGLISWLSTSSLIWRLLAVWFVGVGLNYLALSLHALDLSRPGVLEHELDGVDKTAELRRYAFRQGWVLVPFALVAMALRQLVRRP